ncbi:MAG: hypothetical protein U0441_16880 [Polyangiaceae bacterium]
MLAVLCVVLLPASSAFAQGAPEDAPEASPSTKPWGPRLSYTTVPECAPESTFRDAVAVFYGAEDPFNPESPDLLRVTIAKTVGGYRGSVQYVPASGAPWPMEEVTHASCSALFHSLVLMATLRTPNRPESPPAPLPTTKPTPQKPPSKPSNPVFSEPSPARPEPTFEKQPQPPPSPPMDLTIALTASALMTAGFTADVGPAFQIGAEARYSDWFSLGLEFRGVLPGKVYAREVYDKTNPYSSERAFDASQVSALLVPCLRFAKYFAGCAVGQAGFIVGQTSVETSYAPSFGVGPRLRAELPLGDRFAAFAFGEALFYPEAQGFVYDLAGPNGEPAPNVLWYPSIVSGFVGAGLLAKFE